MAADENSRQVPNRKGPFCEEICASKGNFLLRNGLLVRAIVRPVVHQKLTYKLSWTVIGQPA